MLRKQVVLGMQFWICKDDKDPASKAREQDLHQLGGIGEAQQYTVTAR
jgi:hypothetical protein